MVHSIWKIDLFEAIGKNEAICEICREVAAKKHKYTRRSYLGHPKGWQNAVISQSCPNLTAHGIDEEWKRVKYILAIRELPGSHSAVHVNAAIKNILEESEIEQNRCHVFLRYGAANMKKAF
uniref:Uncharacterized protein n=1 Tax=Ditylenchus dipsaci TaxID=166011 RepID=A0A915EQQ4_9BILA